MRQRITDPSLPVHITARTCNRKTYPIDPAELWRIYEDFLFMLHHGFNVEIFAFVQMNNHFHFLARFPKGNMGTAMNFLQRESSKEINRQAGRENQIYGGRYHSTVIKNEFHLRLAYRYVYQNPVRAGICGSILKYQFSTIRGVFGLDRCASPLYTDALFEDLHFGLGGLEWLDRAPDHKEDQAVREALQKRVFKIPRDRATGHLKGFMPLFAAASCQKLAGTF